MIAPHDGRKILFSFLCLALFAGYSKAGFIIDQSNTGVIAGSVSIDAGPIGQEFVPTLPALDVVELYLHHFFAGDALSNDVAVRIHSGSITGQVLATSQSVTVGDQGFGAEGIVDFTFSSTVALTPGDMYTVELVDLNGPGNVEGLGYTQTAGYSQGQAVISGSPDANLDFYFAEGPNSLPPSPVPEPTTIVLAFVGGVFLALFQLSKRVSWHRSPQGKDGIPPRFVLHIGQTPLRGTDGMLG